MNAITPQADNFQSLPDQCRREVVYLWAAYRYLIIDEMKIIAPIATWIQQHGVNPAKVAEICKALTSPEAMATIKYPSELIAALAEDIAGIRKTYYDPMPGESK